MIQQYSQRLVSVSIDRTQSGRVFATSDKDPSFLVSAPNESVLQEAIASALADLFRERDKEEMTAIPFEPRGMEQSWAVIPRSMLASLANQKVA